MKNLFTTKRICRAGVIAALYVALTCSFGMISFTGIFQVRPAEALTLLPLFFPEAVPALWIGCMLANVISQFGVYDIFGGSAVTLIAALLTFLIGKLFRENNRSVPNHIARVALGGLFPVLLNAAIIPLIIVYVGGLGEFESAAIAYSWNFVSLFISQSLWIYALGTSLYLFIDRMRVHGIRLFLDQKSVFPTPEERPN